MSISKEALLSDIDDDRCWGGFAKIYRRLEEAPPYQRLVQDMAEAMSPQVGESWLDAGCGSGSMTEVILNRTGGRCNIIAADASDTMLGHISRRFAETIGMNGSIRIEKVDLRHSLPFGGEQFDGVVGNLVFPYVDSWHDGQTGLSALRCCFHEVHRVLKPGGKFVWSTPRENPNFVWIFLASWRAWIKPTNLGVALKILRYAQELKWRWKQGLYHYLSTSDLRHLMSDAGFPNIELKLTYADQGWVVKGVKK